MINKGSIIDILAMDTVSHTASRYTLLYRLATLKYYLQKYRGNYCTLEVCNTVWSDTPQIMLIVYDRRIEL